MFYSLCNDKSLSFSLCCRFFLHTSRRAMVAAGRYLSIYIWKERACLNRHVERESELATIQHAYLSLSRLCVLYFALKYMIIRRCSYTRTLEYQPRANEGEDYASKLYISRAIVILYESHFSIFVFIIIWRRGRKKYFVNKWIDDFWFLSASTIQSSLHPQFFFFLPLARVRFSSWIRKIEEEKSSVFTFDVIACQGRPRKAYYHSRLIGTRWMLLLWTITFHQTANEKEHIDIQRA